MSEEKTMLLFGSSGFAGSHVREAAEAKGLRVVGCSREGGGGDLACDLLELDQVRGVVREAEPDLIANMAGSASVAESWKQPKEAFTVNAGGVQNLLEVMSAEAPAAHLLCVSSAEVYGEVEEDELPLTEEQALRPVSPYGESKAAMEEMCAHYAQSRGLRVGIVRAFNQLGPRQDPGFAASGFARQMAAAEHEGASKVELHVGNLAAARDFTDVRDSARAFVSVSERELTATYNMCSGKAVRIESLIEQLRSATPLEIEIVPDPDRSRPIDVPVLVGSNARLREATGWQPRIPIEQTIGDLLEWWRGELASGAGAAHWSPREGKVCSSTCGRI
jgi:GDP-4-dehydro-6-deoxy-D-mannose reductase